MKKKIDVKKAKEGIINITRKTLKTKKSTTCRYRGQNGKYCGLTTHTTCARCKFYEPTIGSALEEAWRQIGEAVMFKEKAEEIAYRANTAYLVNKSIMKRLEKANREVQGELHNINTVVTNDALVAIWQDSVNTYE